MAINPLWDINYLKQNHQMIHYFGLGFIQLKLTSTRRIHFYTPLLPAITNCEDVHNHRYDFRSVIMKGTLNQQIFKTVPGNQCYVENESCKETENASDDTIELCNLRIVCEMDLPKGASYNIKHDVLHRVKALEPTITVLDRGDYLKQYAQVVRFRHTKKVCPFGKKIPEADLWPIVEDMLR
jgi:hypothetical protein